MHPSTALSLILTKPLHAVRRYLISAYEDAKSAVSDARKAERDNAAEALEKKLEEQQLKAKEWHQERDRLKHAIEEARSAGNEQLNEQLLRQETQENESKVGQDRLYSNFKRAESEVAATKAELVSVKKELSSFKAKLQAMTEARDAMEAKLHAAEQLKADEAAAAQTKYAACLSALNAARSAAKHGARHDVGMLHLCMNPKWTVAGGAHVLIRVCLYCMPHHRRILLLSSANCRNGH